MADSLRQLPICLITLCLLLEGFAFAHGEFPAIFDAIPSVDSSYEKTIYVSTFGWIRQDEESGKNTVVCEEMYDGDPYPEFFSVSNDVFLVGHFKGLFRITDGGCTSENIAVNGNELFVRGFASDSDENIYLATSTGGAENDVFKSIDQGLTWTPMGAPVTDIYFTSIHTIKNGPHSMLILGFHSETSESVALWWGADAGWHTQTFASFIMSSLGQPRIYHCDESGEKCLIGWASDSDNQIYLLDKTMEEPLLLYTAGNVGVWDAAIAPDGSYLIATIDALMQSKDDGLSWAAIPDLPPPRCVARIGQTLYTCANPYLPDSFAVASSTDNGDTWNPVISEFNEVHMLHPCPENTVMPSLCEKPWESLSTQFGVPSMEEEPSEPTGSDVGTPVSTPAAKEGGCQANSAGNNRTLIYFFVPILALFGWRHRRALLFMSCLLLVGCGDTGNSQDQADASPSYDDSTGQADTIETPEDIQNAPTLPYRGNIAIGAFKDTMGNSGVILNAVFSQIETLAPPYDEEYGPCKVRTLDLSTPPVEPVGVSAGTISITGDGLEQEVNFIPYDFGEEQGGYAYDHGLGSNVKTLLNESGTIEISIAGEEEIPSLSGSLAAPPENPEVSPAPQAFSADASEAVEYTWTPAGADSVLFELDSFDPADENADVIQVRCTFEDNGSATLPSEVVGILAGKGLSISTAWASTLRLEDATTAVDVIISKRSLAFSFPP